MTRISRGKISLQRERVDVDALARRTAEDHREVFARSGIAFAIEPAGRPLWVDGDPTRLAQAVGNLLDNAAKFTPYGGRATISVRENGRGEAVIRVRDTGVGMAPETIRQMFEAFVQAPQSLERSRGGLGLGLALVKGLVEMHGGSVAARSEGSERGAEFEITLPQEAHVTPKLSLVPAPRGRAGGRRVLVIEDNIDTADSLREALEIGGHEVAVANTGTEGVSVARRLRPDAILCDLGLPGLDGYGVARALRADPDPKVRTALLVALSGYALEEDVEGSRAAGFDRHVAKPPDLADLERALTEPQAAADDGQHSAG